MCVFFRGATVAWVVHFFWHHVWFPALEARIYFGSKSMLVSLSPRFDMNHASKESAYEEKTCQLPWQSLIHRGEANLLQVPTVLKGETFGWRDRKELPWNTRWNSRLCEFATVVGCGWMPWRRLMGSTFAHGQIMWATSRTVGTCFRHCTTCMMQITKRRTRRPTLLLSCPPWSCPLKCNHRTKCSVSSPSTPTFWLVGQMLVRQCSSSWPVFALSTAGKRMGRVGSRLETAYHHLQGVSEWLEGAVEDLQNREFNYTEATKIDFERTWWHREDCQIRCHHQKHYQWWSAEGGKLGWCVLACGHVGFSNTSI